MPIHEYQCNYCGKIFEDVTLKLNDVQESLPCPKCKEGIAIKVMSSGSFVVNGFSVLNGYAHGNR